MPNMTCFVCLISVLLFLGNCSLQWVWFSGGLSAVLSLAGATAAQERFHQDVGEWRQSATF